MKEALKEQWELPDFQIYDKSKTMNGTHADDMELAHFKNNAS